MALMKYKKKKIFTQKDFKNRYLKNRYLCNIGYSSQNPTFGL